MPSQNFSSLSDRLAKAIKDLSTPDIIARILNEGSLKLDPVEQTQLIHQAITEMVDTHYSGSIAVLTLYTCST